MKPLTKYLNPKAKWHPNTEFPSIPVFNDIINFFRNNDFKELEFKEGYIGALVGTASAGHNAFVYDEASLSRADDKEYWIRFCKGDKKRRTLYKIYFLRATESGTHVSKDVGYIEHYRSDFSRCSIDRFEDYDNFVEEIKTEFELK